MAPDRRTSGDRVRLRATWYRPSPHSAGDCAGRPHCPKGGLWAIAVVAAGAGSTRRYCLFLWEVPHSWVTVGLAVARPLLD